MKALLSLMIAMVTFSSALQVQAGVICNQTNVEDREQCEADARDQALFMARPIVVAAPVPAFNYQAMLLQQAQAYHAGLIRQENEARWNLGAGFTGYVGSQQPDKLPGPPVVRKACWEDSSQDHCN